MASTPTPTPTLFSESQRATLRALIDTVLAPLTEQEVASIVREKADLPHLKDAGVTRQQIESFLRTKGSDIPGLLASVENCLQKHAPADVAWELGMLLKVMGTSAGMLALTTSPSLAAPFQDLTSEQRQQVLAGFADSLIAAKRKAFVSLKQFICLQAFGPGPNNALWPAIGYSGPRPSAEVMRDAELGGRPEKDYRPYLLDVESLFKPGADHATIRDGEYDAVVIGSGCGGSVVAARLAENGHRVLVLEKGDFCPREELTGTEADFDRTFERGAIATTEDTGIAVLAGSTLGGGTAVNWACCLEPPRYLREEWAAAPHSLTHFTSPAFQRSLDRIIKRISAVGGIYDTPMEQNKPNQMFIDACRRLGMHVRAAPNNMIQPPVVGDDVTPEEKARGAAHRREMGEIGVGDRHGIKQSMTETYLWDAVQTGKTMIVQKCEARVVLQRAHRSRGVQASGVEAVVTLADGRKGTLTVHSPIVVVAAGSINSPAILLRSVARSRQLSALNYSGMIGKNLRLHPVVGVVGLMPDAIDTWQGAPMTTVSHVVAAGRTGDHYGAKLEVPSIMPGLISTLVPWTNAASYKSLMLDTRRAFAFIVLSRDKGSGYVTLDKEGAPRMYYPVSEHDRGSLLDGLVAAIRIAAEAGAAQIGCSIIPLGIRDLPAVPPADLDESVRRRMEADRARAVDKFIAEVKAHGITTDFRTGIFCAHQMGTCKMGVDKKKSVVRPTGETWGCTNLFVCDTSVFPTSSGVNPMVTVLGIADGIADHVLARAKELRGEAPGAARL